MSRDIDAIVAADIEADHVYEALFTLYHASRGEEYVFDDDYLYGQEPAVWFPAPYEWLAIEDVLVTDRELYERAILALEEFIDEMGGDSFHARVFQPHMKSALAAFVFMHEVAIREGKLPEDWPESTLYPREQTDWIDDLDNILFPGLNPIPSLVRYRESLKSVS